MANSDHLEILAKGDGAWRKWREANSHICPDLSGADMRRQMLRGFDLSGSNLTRADLRDATFRRADLSNANLSGARLYRTVFSGTRLQTTIFKEAVFYETIFADVDLSHACDLSECVHKGPSVLDHRTLRKSRSLPQIFLRGCGLPDDVIADAVSAQDKHFWSCFISYSTKDQDFADQLYADLQGSGVRCWFAPHDIAGGKKVHEQIDEAIRLHDRLLLILSSASMASNWVNVEISKALRREEKEGRRVLFPVRLVDFEALRDWNCFDADVGRDSAREIREYFIPDFSRWQDVHSYQQAFNRLLRDLQRDQTSPSETSHRRLTHLHSTGE